jgi:hypothetical protein
MSQTPRVTKRLYSIEEAALYLGCQGSLKFPQ